MENKAGNSSLLNRWKNRDKDKNLISVIPKAPEDVDIPLSRGQQRIWFLQQLYPDNPFYNYSELICFEGNLNVEYLKASLNRIFQDHEILRSFYPMVNGNPVLRISHKLPEIQDTDLSGFEEESAQSKLDQLLTKQSRTVFDLSSPGLLKISLIRTNADKYVLFFTMHHIIVDEWSIGILKQHLASHYKTLSKGNELQVSNAETQYRDYAYWQSKQSIKSDELAYWKNTLSGELPVLDMQTDQKRKASPLFNGGQITRKLSSELSSDVLGLAKKMETTPFIFLLSVYYILLKRYTGQDDILIGTPISNRSTKSLENIFGFFIDTIVLRNHIDSSLSIKQLVQHIKKNTLEAFAHKNVPFDVLVKELKVDRSLSINPFFQIMFLYHPQEEVPTFGDEVLISDETEFDTKVAKFDLTLSVSEKDGQLSLTFEYDSDLYFETTIVRMLEHYELLLRGVLNDSNSTVKELPMLTDIEKSIFYDTTYGGENIFSSYRAVHRIIDDIGKRFPSKIAVTYKNESITYEELNHRADKIAQIIFNSTSRKNEIIGLCLDRSIDMIVGLLGILKAGCAYLPIDPNYPLERLNFVLEDAQCNCLVSDSSLSPVFEGQEKILIYLDELLGEDSKISDVDLPEVSRDDLAYVIYTSGSSGQPKGVPISHDNIINSTAGRLSFYPENPEAFLLMSSISFDSSKAGIFWTLCTGGNLIVTENRIEQDISQIENIIETNGVTHTLMLPTLYDLVLQHATPSKIASLNTVIVAGEACNASMCNRHFTITAEINTKLYNEYGPTEATVWCTAFEVKSDTISTVIPIGKPVASAAIYLVDKNLNLVPFGAVGEIYVSGPGLAKGYINRPELSKEAFIDNPFETNGSSKLYKTGDLGRYRSDGCIEFLGRVDQQIKLRGYRIELEEVEKAISLNNGITGVVAFVEEVKASEKVKNTVDYNDPEAFSNFLKKSLTKKELNELLASVEKLNVEA
ncbi:amino acid adenylation domain-containing protein [Pseudozobellia sp. WGM2]|uniref:non-ribosomal peptide synthetase n=1 Tax=Pseudozobellia sp. WGM2 TaxID=2787625 RepID=UPI001AE006BA|nr:amino acid adenylation domain-containing protein [Pseudozobellia sp. WGM2]